MNPAPSIPTRIGRPSASRALSALSMMIMASLLSGRRHAASNFGLHFIEELPLSVLGREGGHRQRPAQPQSGVIVLEAPFHGWRIELADVISGLGAIAEALVAVRKAFWNVERAVVVLVEFDRRMPEVGVRLRP